MFSTAEQKISRRDLLQYFSWFIAISSTSLGWAAATGLSVEAPTIVRPHAGIRPGSLELSIPDRPPFLSLQTKGPREYISHICNNDPSGILPELLNSHLKNFLYSPPTHPLKVGEMMNRHFYRAFCQLSTAYPHAPETDIVSSAVHYSMYTLGYVLYPPEDDVKWLSRDSLFGVGLTNDTEQNYALYSQGLINNLQGVMPDKEARFADQSTKDYLWRLGGYDRYIHLIQYMVLTYLDRYMHIHQLPDQQAVPDILIPLQQLPDLGSLNPSKLQSLATGFIWETYETVRNLKDMLANPADKVLPEGFLDPLVQADFAANVVGIKFGSLLASGIKTVEQFFAVTQTLNTPKLYRPLFYR